MRRSVRVIGAFTIVNAAWVRNASSGSVAEVENDDSVVARRDARVASRACVRARPAGSGGNYPVVTLRQRIRTTG